MKYCLIVLFLATGISGSFGLENQARKEAFSDSFKAEEGGKLDLAIQAMAVLYNQNPKDFYVNLRLGWLNYSKANYKNALTHYNAAIANSPKAVNAYMGKVNVLMAFGDFKEAETTCKQLLEYSPMNFNGNIKLANIFAAQKDYDKALAVLEKLLPLYPESVEVLNTKGYFQILSGKTEESIVTFNQVLDVSPENKIAQDHVRELASKK